jgi:glycosyltransferase involved in cell wall biosynthesis
MNPDKSVSPISKIFFVVNVDWFFLSHRLPLAIEAKRRQFDVTIIAIETDKRAEIESHGFKFIPIPTTRSGTNIMAELKVLQFFWKLYKEGKPDIVHHVGVKPVTYGSVIGKLRRLPKIVNALAGMGYLFINKEKNILAHCIVMRLFRFGFKNPNLRFILQNKDDLNDLRNLNILEESQLFVIKGSGVDLTEYRYSLPVEKDKVKIILPARMLWDKGVGEFVAAASILKKKYTDQVEFILVGTIDNENNAKISESQIQAWQNTGAVEWIGFQTNMKAVFESADIVVLPSYREGLPKSLIEACAVGRPIVTTDVPGCREVVEEGFNGYLVPVKNCIALAQSLEKLIDDKELRLMMGKNAREIAENNFSIDSVIKKTFDIYNA